MKCTECPDEECNNEDMKKCSTCGGGCQMLCLCQRPEVRTMVKKLWEDAKKEDELNAKS